MYRVRGGRPTVMFPLNYPKFKSFQDGVKLHKKQIQGSMPVDMAFLEFLAKYSRFFDRTLPTPSCGQNCDMEKFFTSPLSFLDSVPVAGGRAEKRCYSMLCLVNCRWPART